LILSLFANTYLAPKGPATAGELAILEKYKADIPAELYQAMIETGFVPARTKGNGDQRENLDRAGQLLDSAGWKIVKGVRRNSAGELLKIELMYKDAKLEKIVLAFKESLCKLGVELSVRMMDVSQYENRVLERDFDMIIHTWANSTCPGNEQMLFYSQKSADVTGGINYMGLKDPIAESLARRVAETQTQEQLVDRVHALDRYIMNMYYQIPLFYDNTTRFAYWVDKIAFPAIDPKVGTNVMSFAWHPEAKEKVPLEKSVGVWGRVKAFFGSK
jgi:microcin C transport system substrate-binding protein